MLSSALRWGTTDHIAPHELQLNPEVQGVTPLHWKAGDTEFNLDQLLRVSANNVLTAVPELKQVRYNFEKQQFEVADENGRAKEYLDADFRRLANTGTARSIQAGRTTLKRAVVTHTLLSRTGQEGWHGILGNLIRQSSQSRIDPALKGVLYSNTDAAPPNTTANSNETNRTRSGFFSSTESLKQAISQRLGAKRLERLLEQGKLVISDMIYPNKNGQLKKRVIDKNLPQN